MKMNRPLPPHLTVYKPQLTSTFPVSHRISGAFLATMVLFSIFSFKIGDLSPTFYHFYQYLFLLTFYLNWVIISLVNFTLLALCYHMSNGVRHLLWDSGLFLELSKAYTSGIIMLFCAAFSALLNIIRQHWSNGQIPYRIRQRKRKCSGITISTGRNGQIPH
uniref:Succinate dehydrogenase subunit 3 n=2 Tax=Aneura pinguis TaxID=39026 RepID=A0A0E3GNI7_ANEPI|nr:succinate dehydrogenase subunit 3 [Aneura pinguis]YP_010880856.1 succinate dehydrogenase subunit 3 [Aneura maxima]AKA63320.1 succinate dehydrogenase subunit 3 [Aneura pinguis]AKU36843.1 succinate dehydrogenase subunit 3 [Aneura pinguis]ARO74718.1 succinate dehydrogenase subunit 3 [Aneura pinguis]ASN73971.1 succinate dehydrogenase subunit 3 [Aneura pinguis]WHW95788.1 succinate dehydrogenase subunit 3 [Aneura pinguis]